MPVHIVRVTVPGEPVGKARPRVTRRGTYTPQATRDAEARVRAAVQGALGDPAPHPGPWTLVLRFHRVHRHQRDVDNLAKLVMDALNGVLWEDDHQVLHLDAAMVFHPKGYPDARTELTAYHPIT